jgi:cytochrome P450
MIDQRKQMGDQIDDILVNPASLEDADHEIIYHHLLKPQPGKGWNPMFPRNTLLDEALTLRFAGSDTVGNTCTVGTFYVLRDQHVYTKLINELDVFWPDRDSTMSYETLEKLPYLVSPVFFRMCTVLNRRYTDCCHQGIFANGTWGRHTFAKNSGAH